MHLSNRVSDVALSTLTTVQSKCKIFFFFFCQISGNNVLLSPLNQKQRFAGDIVYMGWSQNGSCKNLWTCHEWETAFPKPSERAWETNRALLLMLRGGDADQSQTDTVKWNQAESNMGTDDPNANQITRTAPAGWTLTQSRWRRARWLFGFSREITLPKTTLRVQVKTQSAKSFVGQKKRPNLVSRQEKQETQHLWTTNPAQQ